ncbi:MAG: hypothetical protein ACFB11_19355, partial [Paracoccaceae bacterium]
SGTCRLVSDAPRISQPVFAGVHIRSRHRPAYRKLIGALALQYSGDTEVLSGRARTKKPA